MQTSRLSVLKGWKWSENIREEMVLQIFCAYAYIGKFVSLSLSGSLCSLNLLEQGLLQLCPCGCSASTSLLSEWDPPTSSLRHLLFAFRFSCLGLFCHHTVAFSCLSFYLVYCPVPTRYAASSSAGSIQCCHSQRDEQGFCLSCLLYMASWKKEGKRNHWTTFIEQDRLSEAEDFHLLPIRKERSWSSQSHWWIYLMDNLAFPALSWRTELWSPED